VSDPATNLDPAEPAPASPPTVAPPASAAASLPAAGPAGLTPYQRRKAREAEREAAAERRRQARAAKAPKVEAEAAPEPAPAPPTDPGVPLRSSALRLRDTSVALRVVWRLVGLVVGLAGYELAPLTEKEADEQAAAWLPVVERYPVADRWVTWLALPAVVVEQMAAKLSRRAEVPAK